MDDTGNALLLRADLHTHFDAVKFVFVPKSSISSESTTSESFVTHLLIPSKELGILYHNTALQPIPEVSREFLFARLAWTMFKFLEPFLRRGAARNLIGVTVSANSDGQPVMVGAMECRQLITKISRSRSQSPKKRGREDDECQDGDEPYSMQSAAVHQRKRHCAHDGPTDDTAPDTAISLSSREDREIYTPKQQSMGLVHILPEDRVLDELRRRWLREERLRSDPKGTWEEEENWAINVRRKGVTMGPTEVKRLFKYYGCEDRSEIMEDDNICLDQ
jgi:hypothetical protein